MKLVYTLQFCFSHRVSISLKQSLQEWGLSVRMAFRSPKRSLREIPSLRQLSVRSTTADNTSRRSSSSARRITYVEQKSYRQLDCVTLTDHAAHHTAITGVSSFIFIRKLSLVHSMHRVWMAGLPSYSCEMLNCFLHFQSLPSTVVPSTVSKSRPTRQQKQTTEYWLGYYHGSCS